MEKVNLQNHRHGDDLGSPAVTNQSAGVVNGPRPPLVAELLLLGRRQLDLKRLRRPTLAPHNLYLIHAFLPYSLGSQLIQPPSLDLGNIILLLSALSILRKNLFYLTIQVIMSTILRQCQIHHLPKKPFAKT